MFLTFTTADFLVFTGVCSKVHHGTGHEGPGGEQMYSSTLPSTSALDGVGGRRHAPADLTPGKTQYPLYRRLGGPQGRSGRVWKISPPTGFDPRTVQSVANRYTDKAIPTPTAVCSTSPNLDLVESLTFSNMYLLDVGIHELSYFARCRKQFLGFLLRLETTEIRFLEVDSHSFGSPH